MTPGALTAPLPRRVRTPLTHLACRQTSGWLPGVTLYHTEQRHWVCALPPPAALRSPANNRPGQWAKICPVLPGGEQMTNAGEGWVRSRWRSCVRHGQLAQRPNSGQVRTRPEPNTPPHLALLTESQRSIHQGRWPPTDTLQPGERNRDTHPWGQQRRTDRDQPRPTGPHRPGQAARRPEASPNSRARNYNIRFSTRPTYVLNNL